jgi:hypothetical protein
MPTAPGKLAFCARWLQKGKIEKKGKGSIDGGSNKES